MAIYHFSGKMISRSGGRSAVASAAYRAGEKLYDEQKELNRNYTQKQDVVYKEIFLPTGAPEWMGNREKLWNAVEKAEKRKDAQLAREFNFALPRELNSEERVELAREFMQKEFVARGMVADLCVHDGKTREGEEQPHAHIMLTLRKIERDGFGLKERRWNAKELMNHWRESWAKHANKYLELNGREERIDHRSLEAQGIDLEPQKKIGPNLPRIHEARMREHQDIARENGEKILEEPMIALKALTCHKSTFSHADLARFINRNTVDEEQFQRVYSKVRCSEQLVELAKPGHGGVVRFTTKEMLAIERKMVETVQGY